MKPVAQIRRELRAQANSTKADFFPHFFTPEPGVVDEFLGVTVPKQRVITRSYFAQLNPKEVLPLLQSVVHEERLTALMIWVLQFQKGSLETKEAIYKLYLANTEWINNWDLVDASAREIVGAYLFERDRSVLTKLSTSKSVWERRIAMVATYYFIQRGDFAWTLKLAEQYMGDTHHYIHKATGWMLREVGKKDEQVLRSFLDAHAAELPRTTLRYALERLDPASKQRYMKAKATSQNRSEG